MINIKLVATDLDGTFLKDDRTISMANLKALHLLGERQIFRVVATGRNLRKVMEVISVDVPFDYIVYSSGAGIYNWAEKKHMYHKNISRWSSHLLIEYFRQKDYNFYAFDEAPENHRLWFHKGKIDCEEFNRYFSFHNSFAEQLPNEKELINGLCQFMLIIPENEQSFEKLKAEIEAQSDEIRVIRSSSPVTEGYIWVEVFHRDVSKGHGVEHLCRLLKVRLEETVGVGNDYNDLDLLHITAHSYLTENAPDALKHQFKKAPSNENDAFAWSVNQILGS